MCLVTECSSSVIEEFLEQKSIFTTSPTFRNTTKQTHFVNLINFIYSTKYMKLLF